MKPGNDEGPAVRTQTPQEQDKVAVAIVAGLALQAVQRIEIVRGQGSLQYGPQFGGMVNYILRNGSEINKKFEFETQQTAGSNALFNSFNAIGGKTKKWHYYSFFDHRNGDGWRQNSRYFTNSGFATATYYVSSKISLTAEIMHSHIRSQQPGGLTGQSGFAIDVGIEDVRHLGP